MSLAGDETTEDEETAKQTYFEKKLAGGFEASFEELPDDLDRQVIEKFGELAWRKRCLKQCEWFTSTYRNELTNFYLFTDKDRKEVKL